MDGNEKEYIAGFNNGYLIAKHEPDLYNTIEKGIASKSEYLHAFFEGGKEFHTEKSFLKTKDVEKEKERGIDKER